ncbi:hypothetical protein ACIGCM_03800 [Pseudomonas sp. NPDC078700]|uniref:hypothetical protein n=1 Tax=Pseudomonas sp. NPDC078700 TaxID=3364424 RepID=UPI0037C8A6DD
MKNEYGLDTDYFTRLCAREFSPDVIRRQTPADLARALARAARTACADVFREKEFQFVELRNAGQIKAGDELRFKVAGSVINAKAREVLNPGTEHEEVIYNRAKNHYFITAMAINGISTHKNVLVRIRPED